MVNLRAPRTQFVPGPMVLLWVRNVLPPEDRLQSGELNKDGARHLTEQRDEFLSSFDTITGWPDNPEHRQVALTAILSAFAIALRGQVQEDLIQELRQGLTEPAHEGRRASRVQEIIELRARALWGEWSSYKDTDLGTAKTILPAVTNDLIELLKDNPKKIPQKWRPVENPNEDDNKKAISRIAGRLKRISRSNR
jgi:hypothetical protein